MLHNVGCMFDNWFFDNRLLENYLSNRKQTTNFVYTKGDKMGVPLRSIRGPILYLNYIYDLTCVKSKH